MEGSPDDGPKVGDEQLRWGIPVFVAVFAYVLLIPVAIYDIKESWGPSEGELGSVFGVVSHMFGLALLLVGMWFWIPLAIWLWNQGVRTFTRLVNHPSYFVRKGALPSFFWISGLGVAGLVFFLVMPAHTPVLGETFADSINGMLRDDGSGRTLRALSPEPLRYLSVAVTGGGYAVFAWLNRRTLARRLEPRD